MDISNGVAVVIGVDAWIFGFVGWVGHGRSSQSMRDYGVEVVSGIDTSSSIGKLGHTIWYCNISTWQSRIKLLKLHIERTCDN